jgi:hypothetical protein
MGKFPLTITYGLRKGERRGPSDFVSPPILVRNGIAKRGEIRELPCLQPHSAAPGGEVNHTECAYYDAEGVTAEFNLNLLKRLNREVGMNFNPSLFRHLITWNGEESRIEMHLESLVQHEVMVPAGLDGMELRIRFNKGETIHTENSYKFNTATIDEMLTAAGFAVIESLDRSPANVCPHTINRAIS